MVSETLRVEYLVIIDTSNSFCSDIQAFNNLIQSNSEIKIKEEKLDYRGLNIDYKIQTKEVEETKERFFHIHFQCENSSEIEKFETLLNVIRKILNKVGDQKNNVQILWDDISSHYSIKAYPLIYEVENLMRKLITKFMLTNVGLDWAKEYIPKDVKNSVKGTDKEGKPDFLYKVDFIQLERFLFKRYSPQEPNELLDKIRNIVTLSDLNLDEIKEFVPKSNWEKYFSQLLNCEEDYLKKRWGKLYNFRNRIAHSKGLNRSDYNEVNMLVSDIKEKIKNAIDILDEISLSDADKKIIAENAVIEIPNIDMIFLNNMTLLEGLLRERVNYTDFQGAYSLAFEQLLAEPFLKSIIPVWVIRAIEEASILTCKINYGDHLDISYVKEINRHVVEIINRLEIELDELIEFSDN
ncbi:hypothetical protein COE86_04240 [Bacillus toyonensis]|uniref:HEPN domain-containing protein n=1 Tax=Bacillus toyonensis TaxID=155322 RepID=UPI000BFE4259|nr:HEPN domain-containing protein [Bacillus toyonensis]PHB39090.1 hypothetical protein COE86_04240 [Bacillus toyonensis]